MQKPPSRENHYVPKCYQRRFCIDDPGQLHHLDLSPEQIQRPDGSLVTFRAIFSINIIWETSESVLLNGHSLVVFDGTYIQHTYLNRNII